MVKDADLKFLIENLDEKIGQNEKWESVIEKGNDLMYYSAKCCKPKECEHPLAPKQKKYVRVSTFRSGWRIRKVPGRNACEIKMYHQEDDGLNVEMAKLAFAKGIWSYVCKMDDALRKYSTISIVQSSSATTAVTLMKKVWVMNHKQDRSSTTGIPWTKQFTFDQWEERVTLYGAWNNGFVFQIRNEDGDEGLFLYELMSHKVRDLPSVPEHAKYIVGISCNYVESLVSV